MNRYFLALTWLMPLLLVANETLLYGYLLGSRHDFFVLAVNCSYNLLFASFLTLLWRSLQRFCIARALLFIILFAHWCIAQAAMLLIVKTQNILQPDMLWYSLQNTADLVGVFDAVLSGFWRYFPLLLTGLWLLLAIALIWLVAQTKTAKQLKRQLLISTVFLLALLFVTPSLIGRNAAYKGLLMSFWLYSEPALPISKDSDEQFYFDIKNLKGLAKDASENHEIETVIFIILESGRKDWLANSEHPVLQKMAASSLVFHNAYTTVSHSSKALYSIFCGVYPVIDMAINEAQIQTQEFCLPHWLAEKDFRSVFIQSADGDFEARDQLVKKVGFDAFIDGKDLARLGAKKLGYFSYDDGYLATALEGQLQSNASEKLFISLFSSNSHHPYDLVNEPCKSFPYRCYKNAAKQMDAHLRQILQVLQRYRAKEKTLLVLVGDHGEAFSEHGLNWHDTVPYEEVVNVPMLIQGPNILPDDNYQLRSLIDLPVTVIDALTKSTISQWSMAKSLLSSRGHETIFSYCFYPKSCRSIRTLQKKIIVDEKFGNHQQAAIGDKAQVLESQLQPLQYSSPLINKSEQLKQQLQQYHSQ